jgi:hypothetical protein
MQDDFRLYMRESVGAALVTQDETYNYAILIPIAKI